MQIFFNKRRIGVMAFGSLAHVSAIDLSRSFYIHDIERSLGSRLIPKTDLLTKLNSSVLSMKYPLSVFIGFWTMVMHSFKLNIEMFQTNLGTLLFGDNPAMLAPMVSFLFGILKSKFLLL